MSWDDVSFVMASRNRRAIILMLERVPKTPTIIAQNMQMNLANVSRTLSDLDKKGLVVCLTPKKRVGRIYSLTDKGTKVLEKVREMK